MAMFGVNDNIQGVFKVTKMHKFFTMAKDQTQAIKTDLIAMAGTATRAPCPRLLIPSEA